MTPRPRWLVPAYGCAAGWLAALLIARAVRLSFQAPSATGFPLTYCDWIGYPKIADYAAVAIMLGAGVGGAVAASWGWRRRRDRPPVDRGFWLPLAIASLAGAGGLALQGRPGVSLSLAACSLLALTLPWLDHRWYLPAPVPVAEAQPVAGRRRHWLLPVVTLVGLVWAHDPVWQERALDMLHEGVHLLYVQHALAGERPGVAVRTEYGPLYSHSILWWLRATEVTAEQQRRYFHAARVAGTILLLAAVGMAVEGPAAVLVTAVAMLGLSPSSAAGNIYGWANALRPGLALAALVLAWAGLETGAAWRLRTAGTLLSLALLYSPEFGLAAAVGIVLLWLLAGIRAAPWKAAGQLAGTFALVSALLWLAMFGREAAEALGHTTSGYAMARLAGHGAKPFPGFAWWTSLQTIVRDRDNYLWQLSIWGPLALCCLGAAWLMSRPLRGRDGAPRLVLALIVVTLLFHLPAVARPSGQQAASSPPAVVLGGLLLHALSRRSRTAAVLAASLVLGYSTFAPTGNLRIGLERLQARPTAPAGPMVTMRRLGRLALPAEQRHFIEDAVAAVHARCPAGSRMFLAAPMDLMLPFAADRLTVAPWADPVLATTPAASREVLAALERERPPLVVVGDWLDLPLPKEHPEFWAYIEAHYRLDLRLEDHLFYVRRGPPGR